MKFPILTKSRVGFSIALVSVLTLVGVEICRRAPLLRGNVALACVALGFVGVLLWFKEELYQSPSMAAKATVGSGARPNHLDHPFAFLRSFRYWGFILTTSAVLIYFITPKALPVTAAPAVPIVQPIEPPPLTNAPPETNAQLAVVFPALKLHGLVHSGTNSTVVINGRTLGLGESIGEVKVVAIGLKSVTVELSGESMVLHLAE